MEIEWRKGHSSDTKYPKRAFSGVLKAIYPSFTETAKNTPLLRLDFEDGKTVSLFGLKVEDGEVKASLGLEEFLESLNKQEIEDLWATESDQANGFRTEPDLIGCKLWMKPLEDKTVGDQSQTQTSIFWGVLEKYERSIPVPAPATKSSPKPKPAPVPATPAKEPIPEVPGTPGFDAVSALKDFLLEYLDEPKTEAAIMQAVKKLPHGKEMNDVRKPVLGDRAFINFVNGKYELVV